MNFIICRGGFSGASETIGFVCALGTLLLFIYTFLLYYLNEFRNLKLVKFLGISLILHPAWTMPANYGDHGYSRVEVSYLILGIACTVLAYEYGRYKFAKSPRLKFIITLIITSLFVYLGALILEKGNHFWVTFLPISFVLSTIIVGEGLNRHIDKRLTKKMDS